MAQDITLQNAAVANGNGSPFVIGGAQIGMVEANVNGITTATINWEGTGDNTHWVALQAYNVSTGAWSTTATADGIYLIPTQGMEQVRARISGWSAGTITILAKAVAGSGAELPAGAVALAAGEAHAGSVGGDLLTVVDTLIRPANTTAYATGKAINNSLAVSTVSNVSNPVVTTTAAHGLLVGQWITIAGVVGATGVNGNWKVATTPSGTTLTLQDVSGVAPGAPGAYTSGGTIAQLLVFPNIGRIANGHGYITKAKVEFNSAAFVGAIRLWLYKAPVTAQVDQADFAILYANAGNRVGYIDLTLATEGTGSDCVFMQDKPNLEFTAGVNGELYGRLEAKGAITPTSGMLGRVALSADRY